MSQPTIRIVSGLGDVDAQYYCTPDDERQLARIRHDLATLQREEPNARWHLETRGTSAGWHRWAD